MILNAVAVFVYSQSHIDFMHGLGRREGIYLIPMYSISVYYPHIAARAAEDESASTNATARAHLPTPNDVMMAMSSSARRERFMDDFSAEAAPHGLTVIRAAHISNFNFFDVRTREFLGAQFFAAW